MESQKTNELIRQLITLSYKLSELEKNPVDFGTGEKLYPSEIHTIDAVGDQFNTVSAISKKFGITKGAVSQVIIKLVKKGYVEKKRNEAYSKEKILSLTDKGLKAYTSHKEYHQVMDAGLTGLVESYPEAWVCAFQRMLEQFEVEVDQYLLLGKSGKLSLD